MLSDVTFENISFCNFRIWFSSMLYADGVGEFCFRMIGLNFVLNDAFVVFGIFEDSNGNGDE